MKKVKRKKKTKLKIKNIALFIGFIILIIFVISPLGSSSAFKVTLDSKVINIGTTFKDQFKASFKGVDVKDKVKVDSQIKKNKLGTYKIIFTYVNDGKKYTQAKKIQVKDIEKPTITLTRGNEINVLFGSDYKDPGYEVTDNYDKDLKDKVKVSGSVDPKKEGTYKVYYIVKDSSGNEAKVVRSIKVTKDSPLNQSVKDFSLDGFFTDVLLKETKDFGSDYSDDFIFAGDSTALYYVINKQITGKRLWHKEGIDPETALTNSIYINHIETNKTFIENFKEYKPSKVVMTLGTNSAAYMKPDYFIKNYKKLLKGIMDASPDTLLIVQAIPPVASSYDLKETGINNDKINKLNYYILELCSELKIPFLNSAEALKDSSGALKEGYYIKDGIHLSKAGNQVLMDYFENHAYTGDK